MTETEQAEDIIKDLYFIIQSRINYDCDVPLKDAMARAKSFLDKKREAKIEDKRWMYRQREQNELGADYFERQNEWHDLRKNPNDVPKENVTVLLLTEVEPVTARYDKKYESFFRLNDKLDYCVFIAPMSCIAWCEIPKFEEHREDHETTML